MNIYSDDRFCDAFRAAYYPEHPVQPALFQLGGRLWRLPAFRPRKPLVTAPFQTSFIDFFEPYDRVEIAAQSDDSSTYPSTIYPVKYLPRASHGRVRVTEWVEQRLEQFYEAAPTIVWDQFASWDEFGQHVRQNRSKGFADSRRRRRKLEQEVGDLTFRFHDDRPEAMTTCMQWKSDQYQRSKCVDHFAQPQHVQLFTELAQRGVLLVSSLSAGDRLLAVHMGVLVEGHLYWWVPAYDETYGKYSPGRLLLELVLEESFQQGHHEFDFLISGPSYKWDYATHTRLIAELGTPPLWLQVRRSIDATKRTIKAALRRSLSSFPKVLKTLETMRANG